MDLAFLGGFALWRLRRRIQRKADTDPPHMLADAIRNSVFFAGFRLVEVENPALRDEPGGPTSGTPPLQGTLVEGQKPLRDDVGV